MADLHLTATLGTGAHGAVSYHWWEWIKTKWQHADRGVARQPGHMWDEYLPRTDPATMQASSRHVTLLAQVCPSYRPWQNRPQHWTCGRGCTYNSIQPAGIAKHFSNSCEAYWGFPFNHSFVAQ